MILYTILFLGYAILSRGRARLLALAFAMFSSVAVFLIK